MRFKIKWSGLSFAHLKDSDAKRKWGRHVSFVVALRFRVYEEMVLMTVAERRRRSLNYFPTITSLINTKKFIRVDALTVSVTPTPALAALVKLSVEQYCELATTNKKVSTGRLASWSQLRRTWSESGSFRTIFSSP